MDRQPHQDSAIFGVIGGQLDELVKAIDVASDKQIREVAEELLAAYGVLLDEFIRRTP